MKHALKEELIAEENTVNGRLLFILLDSIAVIMKYKKMKLIFLRQLKDGGYMIFRPISHSDSSPAIDINTPSFTTQKIHFINKK